MRGYAAIGLVSPKREVNVGGVLRAAQVYGAVSVAIQGQRYQRCHSDTMKAWRHMPVLHTDDLHSLVPFNCIPVAIEMIDGAIELPDYVHPERAFYIFGPEDSSLGKETLSWCRDVVCIPSGCMNLAACVNVVLYDRLVKRRFTKTILARDTRRAASPI